MMSRLSLMMLLAGVGAVAGPDFAGEVRLGDEPVPVRRASGCGFPPRSGSAPPPPNERQIAAEEKRARRRIRNQRNALRRLAAA